MACLTNFMPHFAASMTAAFMTALLAHFMRPSRSTSSIKVPKLGRSTPNFAFANFLIILKNFLAWFIIFRLPLIIFSRRPGISTLGRTCGRLALTSRLQCPRALTRLRRPRSSSGPPSSSGATSARSRSSSGSRGLRRARSRRSTERGSRASPAEPLAASETSRPSRARRGSLRLRIAVSTRRCSLGASTTRSSCSSAPG
mmetsp:Transcript_14690/g.42812  ORF Transcript_14690/g.42812 Transcript_14690/m.42812 type:complete len:200 (-) Transcript_14690:549-1148(-)